MKYSSIATTVALVALTNFDVVAAASRTRGVERADTEHRALSPDKKAGGKGGNCRGECNDGAVYYKYVNYKKRSTDKEVFIDGNIPFEFALENTPFNCVLAPVESAADLLEIEAVIPISAFGTEEGNAWVSIGKSAADVADDKSDKDKLEDWVNLDGSNVPVDSNLWAKNQPNNKPPYQTRAHFYGADKDNNRKLRDVNPQGGPKESDGDNVVAAVYKCCFDLCPEEPPVDCEEDCKK